jgi:hypothetical protein
MERCISLEVEKTFLRYMNIYHTQKYLWVELIVSNLCPFHIPANLLPYVLVTRHKVWIDYWINWMLIIHDYK